jgi:isoamylase
VFRRVRFLRGASDGPGLPDAWWFRPDGRKMTQRDWRKADGHVVGVFLNGEELHEATTEGEEVVDDSFLLLFNAHHEAVTFTLPAASFGATWESEISTAEPSLEPGARGYAPRATVEVAARSVYVLRRDPLGVT